MMRERRITACLALTISLPFAFSLTGCRDKLLRPGPPEAELEAQEIRAADAHPPAWANALPDDVLLSQHAEKGLELALKIDAPSYRSGEAIPFHILIRDRAATVPIAAGMCSGLNLAWERLNDNTMEAVAIDNHRCFNTIPSPDEVPLVRGAVNKREITQRDASNTTLPPGRYLVNLSWQPYAAGRGTIMDRQPYAVLKSNVILFTVTP